MDKSNDNRSTDASEKIIKQIAQEVVEGKGPLHIYEVYQFYMFSGENRRLVTLWLN